MSNGIGYKMKIPKRDLRPAEDTGYIAANGHQVMHVAFDMTALEFFKAFPELPA